MNRIDNATIAHNMKWGMILLAGLVLALFLGTTLAADSVKGVATFAAFVFPCAWIMMGSKYWWLPLPFGVVIGGTFQFGFKIMPHELGLAMAVACLATAIPLRWHQMYRNREAIHFSILLLCAYLILHWAGSLLYNKYMGLGGAGNVSRAYAHALWPVIFIICFHLFGNSKQARIALYLILGIAIYRVILGYLGYFFNIRFYIPIINYIPPGLGGAAPSEFDPEGNVDFRFSGPLLATFALFAALLAKRHINKIIWYGLFALGAITTLAGGGRAAMVGFAIVPFLWLILYRKWLVLISVGTIASLVVAVVNIFPSVLDPLPYQMNRSLTVLMLDQSHSRAFGDVASSNYFHQRMTQEAVSRWTESWNTIVLGTGIRPFNRDLYAADVWSGHDRYDEVIKNAANTGNYEKGLWNVLAVTGLVGLLLYLNAFRCLVTYVFKSLWNNKICDAGHAFAFLGACQIIIWVCLSWRFGFWPSEAIFYAYLGYVWIRDQEEEAKLAEIAKGRKPTGAGLPASSGPRSQPGSGPEYGNPAYS